MTRHSSWAAAIYLSLWLVPCLNGTQTATAGQQAAQSSSAGSVASGSSESPGQAVPQSAAPQNAVPPNAGPQSAAPQNAVPAQVPQNAAPAPVPQNVAPAAPQRQPATEVIQGIVCDGNRRVPCSTVKTRIFTKPGDVFSPAQIHRDLMSLWNSNLFDDVRIEREDTPQGIILHVVVQEKRLIRAIKYKGLKSITESDIQDRNKARNVHLTRDSPYDPTIAKQEEQVIKELLSEHGRQYATVKIATVPMPPSSIELDYDVSEGPKVQVGKIGFRGNEVLNAKTLRRSMKNLHPIGIPHSLLFENLFAKTYDQAKLSEDLERVRGAYQDRGYFNAVVEDPTLKLRDSRSTRYIFFGGHPQKKVDITIPVVEGKQYRVGKLTFINSRFITNQQALEAVLGLRTGEILNVSKLRKGLQNLQKLYGQYGYINFVAQPQPLPNEQKQTVDITFDVQEGKPFFIRRIEFSGNTTTRDKVIRRELLVEEGQRFNNQAWENSLLRLNQLGYFEELKPENAEIKQDTTGPEGKVDIDLHVKEKGKNTIGLTGGVSGILGSFLGLNYSTNNFLGLGETLSFATEYGALQRSVQFGFTEPYLYDKPIQLAFTAYISDFRYDQAKQASIFAGQNLSPFYNAAYGFQNLLNYSQNSKGFTVGTSYPLKRSFTRLGLTYGYDISSLTPLSNAANILFDSISFRTANGPSNICSSGTIPTTTFNPPGGSSNNNNNSVPSAPPGSGCSGIRTSRIIPSVSYNTVNSYFNPTRGKDIELSSDFAGLGGNVKLVRPSFQMRYFHPAWKNHVVGMRLLGSWVTGYGGVAPPTFDRFFIGGENDIRGFDLLAVTPIAMVPTLATTYLQDPYGRSVLQTCPTCFNLLTTCPRCFVKMVPAPTPSNPRAERAELFPVTYPSYQITTPGGDTQGVLNFEYRIPIVGNIVQLAYFADTGVNMITMHDQLRVNQTVLNALQSRFGRSFDPAIPLVSGTNTHPRMSTGLELQVMLPVIQAPFRVYYALNPVRVDQLIKTPNIFSPLDFSRAIGPGFQNDADVLRASQFTMNEIANAPGFRFREAPHVFRFTIGRTF